MGSVFGRGMATTTSDNIKKGDEYYRHDGVKITHDPFAPGMVEKYGKPGATDNEGFDPYRDSVGPGIYGGIVERDEDGEIKMGRQYQNHNPRPGPVYAGGGYAPIADALGDDEKLRSLVGKYPDLVNDITTGGAQPLHLCGMSHRSQMSTEAVVRLGGDIEALDTYGMTPLHRMASNNLAVGAKALLAAGADPNNGGKIGEPPLAVARDSTARDVMKVLQEYADRQDVPMTHIIVENAGEAAVNGKYFAKEATNIPQSFGAVCDQNGWPTNETWNSLNGKNAWFSHDDEGNDSYVYYNKSDGKWWLDGPDGLGRYTHDHGVPHAVPAHGWTSLHGETTKMPQIRTYRDLDSSKSEL